MATQTQNTLAARCPRALAAGRIVGSGRYALLTCPDKADGIRRVYLYHTAMERVATLRRWEGNGPNTQAQCPSWSTCTGDHVLLDLEE
jgi:hypothetical protein